MYTTPRVSHRDVLPPSSKPFLLPSFPTSFSKQPSFSPPGSCSACPTESPSEERKTARREGRKVKLSSVDSPRPTFSALRQTRQLVVDRSLAERLLSIIGMVSFRSEEEGGREEGGKGGRRRFRRSSKRREGLKRRFDFAAAGQALRSIER